MSLATGIQMQLVQFLKPKIVLNPKYNQYSFNGNWLIDVTENDFKEEALNILLKVNGQLQVGLENKKFLIYMLEMINTTIDWFEEKDFKNISAISHYAKTIRLQNLGDEHPPRNEAYTIEYILTVDEVEASLIFKDNYYYNIRQYANFFQDYLDVGNIENVKLHYVLDLYHQYLMKLYHYLDDFIINFESINFSEYEFDSQLSDYGFIELTNNTYFKRRCHVNLNKKDTASLFLFLLDEGIFEFDKNYKKNKVATGKFIEEYFSYSGDMNAKCEIKNIKQAFSELSYGDQPNSNQLPLIEKLIDLLQLRKSRIIK